jgi:hypothetical protein
VEIAYGMVENLLSDRELISIIYKEIKKLNTQSGTVDHIYNPNISEAEIRLQFEISPGKSE